MMTFEQFFLKKKIDLDALKATKSDLFLEFKVHYAQMGEKSFDHTKKYWFNQLRLSHRISEEKEAKLKVELYPPKEVLPALEDEISISTEAPVTKAPGFKARFKAPVKTEIDKVISEEKTEEIPKATPGFKPRFRATAVVEMKVESEILKEELEKPVEETPKAFIGFKPRFKANASPAKQEETDPLKVEIKEDVKKPAGFKPRFKAGNTPAKQEDKKSG